MTSGAARESAPGDDSISVTDQEFALFQTLIYREAGISLGPSKKPLLVGRLAKRVKELGLQSLGAYYRRVLEGGEEELTRLLDCIATNETHFFREPRHFEFLESHVIPEWKTRAESGLRERTIRVWSAGCSTGEEPYSLAMVLLTHCPPEAGWTIDILATDLSTRVLDLARAAVWPLQKAREIPQKYLKPFMLRGTNQQDGKMKAGPETRSVIRFARVNLHQETSWPPGRFDLIFCRNVLIYFSQDSKARVIDRLLSALDPHGYLCLGHAESLNGLTSRVACLTPTVYMLAERLKAHHAPPQSSDRSPLRAAS